GVRPRDHHRRVPPDEGADPPLHVLVAGEPRLVLGRDRVDIRRRDGGREAHLGRPGPLQQLHEQEAGPGPAPGLDDGVERVEALRAVETPVEVVSDSTYVVNCFRQRWWETWLRKGWRNARGQPVANQDLWKPLVELARSDGGVTFRWVKGHSVDPYNDLVDR